MALKPKNTAAAEAAQFEDTSDLVEGAGHAEVGSDDPADNSKPAVEQAGAAATAEQKAEPAKTTAVTAAKANPLAAYTKPAKGKPPVLRGGLQAVGQFGFTNPYEQLEGKIDAANIPPGAFVKLLADRSGMELDGVNVGEYADVLLISHNNRWVVTPGADGDEAKKLVRSSFDQVTISDEFDDEGDPISVKDYLAKLKTTEGYDKATVKAYKDMWVQVIATAKDGVIDVASRTIAMLQLSPQSVGKWAAFCTQAGVGLAQGTPASAILRVKAIPEERGGKKYARLEFTTSPLTAAMEEAAAAAAAAAEADEAGDE